MKTASVALTALVVLSATAACGGEQTAAAPAAPATSGPPASAPSTGGAGEGGTLKAVVVEPDEPDAFTIALQDESGSDVTSLPAGTYEVEVSDLSEIHNFHLTGPGVDESTSVPEVVDKTWTITLEQGTYRFVCDPHPGMSGEVTVT